MKTMDDYFHDWERTVFGYGYGSGEWHTIPSIIKFFQSIPMEGLGYDYEILESDLGGAVAWLLINTFCHADILEYGTSPRYGWITKKGKALRSYLKDKSTDDVFKVMFRDCDYIECYPNHCNCDGEKCNNPFW